MDSRKLSAGKKVVDLSLKLGLPDYINGGDIVNYDEDEDDEVPASQLDEQEQLLLKRFSYTPLGIQMDLGECWNSGMSQQCRATHQMVRDPLGMTRSWWGCLDGQGSSCSGSGSGRGRLRLPLQVDQEKNNGEEIKAAINRRRCTNLNCNTLFTPMWRRGPLGPKTLCNACGIKYRKDREKCRSKEAAACSQPRC